MIEELWELLWSVRLAGLPGRVILGCLALYLPAWAVLVWRGAGRRAPIATAFVALFGLGSIGGGLALVVASRRGSRVAAGLDRGAALAPLSGPRLDRVMDAWRAIELGEVGLLILAIALLATALFGVALVARKALSPARPRPMGLALSACAFSVGGAVALALLDRAMAVLPQRARHTISVEVLGEMVQGSLEAHHASRSVLLAGMSLGVAIAGVVWWHGARDPVPPRPWAALAGVGLFVAGLGAMAATRAHAADAANPIPSRDRLRSEWLFDEGDAGEDLDFLPDATRCEPWELDRSPMPESFHPPVVRIDGPTATFKEETFHDGAALGRRLVENHVRAWGNAHRGLPIMVTLRMGRDVRTTDLVRWFRALREVSVAWMRVEAILRRSPWPSRTLGDIPGGGHRCSLRLTWGDGDRVMSAFPTFGDVVAEMERSPQARWAP